MRKMFAGKRYLIAYLIVALLLFSPIIFPSNIPAIIGVLFFIFWDITYYRNPDSFSGRDENQLIQQVITSRTYVSYFIPIYGIVIGAIFALENVSREKAIEVLNNAGIPLWFFITPFLLSTLDLLLFPVQMTYKKSKKPTEALKSLFLLCFLFEKTIIFLFSFIVVRIALSII